MRSLQEQVKKAFCYQKLFWPITVWINCFSDLKPFSNSWPLTSNFQRFLDWSTEHFFLKEGQNNFDNKIPLLLVKNYILWGSLQYSPLLISIQMSIHSIHYNTKGKKTNMNGDRLNLSDHYYHQFFLFQGWIGASVVNRNHYGTFQISRCCQSHFPNCYEIKVHF